MEENTAFAPASRPYPQAFPGFNTGPASNSTFVTHLDPNLNGLDNGATFSNQFAPQLDSSHGQAISLANAFPQRNGTTLQYQEMQSQAMTPPQPRGQPQRQPSGQQQVDMLASSVQVPNGAFPQTPAIQRIQQDNNVATDEASTNGTGKKETTHFSGMKKVLNPPDLARWRERLFNVDDTIIMTEDEFQTYFPHIDNVYSHRSTQRYKRKPFVSHYWDCRLKGRPPGTPKSNDPNKKKRKRLARERDLCDVKIKITEYFPGGAPSNEGQTNTQDNGDSFFGASEEFDTSMGQTQPFGVLKPLNGNNSGQVVRGGQKYFTIQRVNGGVAGGSTDDVASRHKHTLEDSDRIKKNSILREIAKEEKDKKKTQKTHSKKATGAALATVRRHSKDHELKLFGSCYCPFVQRVWIALELKGMDYQYIEVPDLYDKPKLLTDINPRGLIPAIRHGDWGCYESTVLLEYLEDLNPSLPLFPPTAQQKAHTRLWSDHVNRHIIPCFYRLLQAQEVAAQASAATEMKAHIDTLVDAADPEGPFFIGAQMTMVDTQLAPWMLRFSRVLKPYRGWPDPEEGSRWKKWIDAVEAVEAVKRTISGPEVYTDSYARYAENRPGTSKVAEAVNSGRGLP